MSDTTIVEMYETFKVPVPVHNDLLLTLISETLPIFCDLRKKGDISADDLGEDVAAYVEDNNGKPYICVFFGYDKHLEPTLYAEALQFMYHMKWKIGTYDYDVKFTIADADKEDPSDLGDRFIFDCMKTTTKALADL
jgi:hypothetical protein